VNNFRPPQREPRTAIERVRGIGSQYIGEPPPETDQPGAAQSGIPGGWSALRSRSRFGVPPRPYNIGHGETVVPERAPARPRDPILSQFLRVPIVVRQGDIEQRSEDAAALGRDDLDEGYRPQHRFFPTPSNAPTALVMPSWTKAGPQPQPFQWLANKGTLRREFLSDAQHFTGLHTLVEKESSSSTSPVRMVPARQPRLTRYVPPPSYGQQTEVLE
jgi:hypothetical protein